MDIADDSAQRYADACIRRAYLIEKWDELDKPVLASGGATGKAEVPHPLIAMMKEADALCDRLAKSVRSRDKQGRPVGSSSAPDRGEPPRVTLRSVS